MSVRYEIQSPRDVNLDLQTSNGRIEIANIDGRIDATTSNGAIDVTGGADRVDLHTSNGRIELRGASGRIHVSTSNGAIVASLGTVTDEAVFSTSNSSIDVTIDSGIAPVMATTDNGSIDITLPGDFSGKLDARTTNGQVSSEFAVTHAEDSKTNRLIGDIGGGGDAAVTLRSSNGHINLRKGHISDARRRRM